MPATTVSPYGSWESPITADLITEGGLRLGEVHVDSSTVYWLEGRPEESGRYVIVRLLESGETEDVNPAPFN
ncbi:MAG: S9 family peptidase, partial [Dehalococcoidia bacterium]